MMIRTQVKRHLPLLLLIFIALVFSSIWSVWTAMAQDDVLPLPGSNLTAREFSQLQHLNASDGAANDLFGYGLSLDGDRLLVSAPLQVGATGAAYIFERTGSTWTEVAKLVADDGEGGDSFGIAVALQGNIAVMGSPQQGANNKGAVYIFRRDDNGNWNQKQKLKQTSLPDEGNFGISLSLSGNRMMIGSNKGIAYVYEKGNNGNWQFETDLELGGALIMSHLVGDTLLAGSPNENTNRGAAYIYQRVAGAWTQIQRLTASDGEPSHYFGSTVKFGDGEAFIQSEDDGSRGAVYVFKDDGGNWVQRQKLIANDAADGDMFGGDIEVQGDTLLLGSWDDEGGGSIYFFGWNGVTWTQQDKLAAVSDGFGYSIELQGSLFISGAPETQNFKGKVYVYRDPGLAPTSTPETPAATSTSIPSTPAPTPTNDPIPSDELLTNGGFEQDITGWTQTNTTSDKVKCNKAAKVIAHSGTCAWQFKGGIGEASQIEQLILNDSSRANPRVFTTLTFSGFVQAKGAVDSKIKIVIAYNDPAQDKTKLTIKVSSETRGVYVPLSDFQPILSADLLPSTEAIKVQVKNSSESGKVYYDGLSLVAR